MISLKDCIKRRVYKINCRNLTIGVYDGNTGFVGIRTKFNSRFLFTEFHHDTGSPFGTVKPVEDMGIDLPDNIKLEEYLGTVDKNTNKPVHFVKERADKIRGRWVFDDNWSTISKDIYPMSVMNKELFEFLDNLNKENEV